MQKLLEQATAATQQENWSLVNQYLRQLVENDKYTQVSIKAKQETQNLLKLGLQVLEQGDFQARWDVAKMLPRLGENAILPLRTIVEDEQADLEQRWFALRILAEFQTPEVVTTFVSLLDSHQDENLSAIATNALVSWGESSIPVLSNLLVQPELRCLVTKALGQIHHAKVITPLLTVVKDEDVEVRTAAIGALSHFRDHRIIPVLIAALQDYAAPVRKEAIIALGLRAKPDFCSHLIPLLHDLNLQVCQQAAIALGRIETDTAADGLFTVLQLSTTPTPLKITIIQTLGWMETAASLQYLQQVLWVCSLEVALEIVRTLGRIKAENLQPIAAKILVNFFNSGHPTTKNSAIKQALAHTWGQLASADALPVLEHMQTDTNKSVKLHAIAALKRLSSLKTY
ncbi:MAG: HEAT repeat domain-containing protein [Calothrix sp. MO_167.B42]|nr:HEAT repeat domain-containing protein [Calothrix sp. MO_167.B42]